MTIQAIETEYAGHRFRSRLEARWAVFFDKLGIRWQYEPQGYTVPNGARYLPDFYLPGRSLWVEVKGSIDFEQSTTWHTLSSAAQIDGLPVSYEVGTRWADGDVREMIGPRAESGGWAMLPTHPRLLILGEVPRPERGGAWLHPCLYLVCGRPHVYSVFLSVNPIEKRLLLKPFGRSYDAISPPRSLIPHGRENGWDRDLTDEEAERYERVEKYLATAERELARAEKEAA